MLGRRGLGYVVLLGASSPGGSLARFSSRWFVDPASSFGGTPDGSAGAPFVDIQTAFDAFVASARTELTIVCCPGALGALVVPDNSLSSKRLAIVADASQVANTAPSAAIGVTLGATSGGCLVLQGLYVSALFATAESFGSSLTLVGCYVLQFDMSGWSALWAEQTTFSLYLGVRGAMFQQALRDCYFTNPGAWDVPDSCAWEWDNASERRFFARSCRLPLGTSVVLRSLGSDPDAQQAVDAHAALTASVTRLVYPGGVLTVDRTLTIDGAADAPSCVVVDCYAQDASLSIVDAGEVLLCAVTAGIALRAVVMGLGQGSTAVHLASLCRLQGT